ncbi:MAG: PIG-L family deacetylase [Tepidiformaceae bacterium]
MTSNDLTLDGLGRPGRVVVIAPHPDDEVFAVGGLMAMLSSADYELEIVAVTDGEASHANSSRITKRQLREVREDETRNAYRELGIHPPRFRIGLPDSDVEQYAVALREMLAVRLKGASIVFAPLETDGHPDHDTTGRVAREVAAEVGATLWRFAVWARIHPERITQGEPVRVRLPWEVLERKRRAAATYVSQFQALGPNSEDGPVLPPGFMDHFVEDRELLWRAS